MKKSGKFLLESGVLLTALSIRAKKAGKGIKEYFYEAETIKHISLVLYDLLPLSVKIGMRYEKFHEIFERNFKAIRNALLGKDVQLELSKTNEQEVNTIEESTIGKQSIEKAESTEKPVKKLRKIPSKTTTTKTVKNKATQQK